MELSDAPQLAASCNWQALDMVEEFVTVVGELSVIEDAAGGVLREGLFLALSLVSGQYQGSVPATVSDRLLSGLSVASLCAPCGATINALVHVHVRSDTDVFANAAISTDTQHATAATDHAEHHDKHNGCGDHHHHHGE